MPIDTSSYYPEVPSPDGDKDSFSLNRNRESLFGPSSSPSGDNGDQPQIQEPPVTPALAPEEKETGWARLVTGISNFLSWILVPLLMPVYGLILAFGLSILDVAPMGMRIIFTLIVAGIDVLIPMLLIVLLKRLGVIDDLGLNGRKERLIPYVITTLCFAATAWFMAIKGAPMWLSMFFAGGALASLINLVVNLRWKISAHAAGIAGIIALLVRIERDGSPEPELMGWLIASVILTGLLGSARVWLGRHTVWQVLAGYVVGFCCVFFLTMI